MLAHAQKANKSMNIEHRRTENTDIEVYVLCDNKVEIGYVKVSYFQRSIMDIFVKENLRKKGNGKKLLQFVESEFIKKGYPMIRTSRINSEALGFFEKNNYKIDSDGIGSKRLLTEF